MFDVMPNSKSNSNSNRKMRGFKRWMKHQGIECSDALLLIHSIDSVSVKALCDLHESDVVATIPKHSCLTVKTSAANHIIEEAQLGGYLGLAVALMYEKSLGPQSKWFQYLQLLPISEPIPLLWSIAQIDSLLVGTELHKIIKEDKALVYQDWKECIRPLLDSDSFKLNPDFFGVDEYFAAKSLIASRSFQIDEYHGTGMVPLADLFNHKTAAEDVHFTSVSSTSETDTDDENDGDDEIINPDSNSEMGSLDGRSDLEVSSTSADEPTFMEMIIIKDVKAGAEVFNTYGSLGNAALLHRYGFTEPDNPFDILNIDLEIVVQWSLSSFSCRQSRRRLTFWRKLNYSGCVSQNSEYFEISLDGEPQIELLILLHIILLPEDEYEELDVALTATGELNEKKSFLYTKDTELSKKLLLTQKVGEALLSLADIREGLYGRNSLEDDMRMFNECCCETNRELYHSLLLRISERRIIEKLRAYVCSEAGILRTGKNTRTRKRVD
ncbi:hypothetical protein ACJIZ3_002373 [Penstemon smallii]|uniref:N-lysine methyltransferase n=1 Tax=Penstemon smallii TaxID=265156 RepID=A0ABD3U6L6_9LAMI